LDSIECPILFGGAARERSSLRATKECNVTQRALTLESGRERCLVRQGL
jgi:hypothetical protein